MDVRTDMRSGGSPLRSPSEIRSAEKAVVSAGTDTPARHARRRRCRYGAPVRRVVGVLHLDAPEQRLRRVHMRAPAPLTVWINDDGYRSYYCGLAMLATVHMLARAVTPDGVD